jgi:hypothetical protein
LGALLSVLANNQRLVGQNAVQFTAANLTYLLKTNYDPIFRRKVYSDAKLVNEVRCIYDCMADFSPLAAQQSVPRAG